MENKKQADAAAAEERYARTVKRLENLQEQFTNRPGAGKLAGKVCIVTGVGSKKGIGRAAAFAYAHEGAAHLYLLDFNGADLPELESSLKEKYPDVKATVVQGDAADESLISTLCSRAIEEEGRLDVFFANAGIASADGLADITSEKFMTMMRVNVLSCFLAIKHGSAAMKKTSSSKPESGGSILMTASVAGLRSGAGPPHYSASKAAVESLSKTGACHLAGTNIRVNTVSPGLIETGMTTTTFDFARAKGVGGKVGQLAPLQRYGIAEEVASVALFLASDDSSYVNAQNIVVDGGLSGSLPVAPGRFW